MSSAFAVKMASVNFGSKNTWDDWQMVPASRPIIAPPAPKTNIVDIPAANGQIDLMQALIGYPVYKNRTGSLKFKITNKSEDTLQDRVNDISRYLHGMYMEMVLDDEPEYYYYGRYEVSATAYKGSGENGEITIKYDVEPYKYIDVQRDGSVSGTDVILEDIWKWAGVKKVTPQVVISNATGAITFYVYNSDTEQWTNSTYEEGIDQWTSGSRLTFGRFSERLKISGTGDYSLIFTAGVL